MKRPYEISKCRPFTRTNGVSECFEASIEIEDLLVNIHPALRILSQTPPFSPVGALMEILVLPLRCC